MPKLITGAHAIIYSRKPDADRTFLRDVLGLPHVDIGDGWLIFSLPPAELAIHPSSKNNVHELYLMCDDVDATVAELTAKGVTFSQPITDQGWGRVTAIRLPGGMELGLYEPRHPTAVPDTDMA